MGAVFDKLDNEALFEVASSPEVSPALGDLTGLPQTLVITGSCETLQDSQSDFVEKLKGAGVKVESKVYDDMPHAVGLVNFMCEEEKESPVCIVNDYAKFVEQVCGTTE